MFNRFSSLGRRSLASGGIAWLALACALAAADPRTSDASCPWCSSANEPVCTATGLQSYPVSVSDGNGGAIIAWADRRAGGGTGGSGVEVYAQHVAPSGLTDSTWPVNGVAVCVLPGTTLENFIAIVSDGAGGAILSWADFRNGNYDVYAQRVKSNGTVDAAWTANGQPICTAAGDQFNVDMCPDGAGGAIISWRDSRPPGTAYIYAHHVKANGAVDVAWPANGRALCPVGAGQNTAKLVPDGAGGAIVAWRDFRTETFLGDVYAQHVLSSGAIDGSWPASGTPVCNVSGEQSSIQIVSDGSGGAIMAWQDGRSGSLNIYAQRVKASGIVDPAWLPGGKRLCTSLANQRFMNDLRNNGIVSDGAGGAIVAWMDERSDAGDIFAQHVLASGQLDGAWFNSGTPICVAPNQQNGPVITSDGAGGAIIAWFDNRNPGSDIYAQRVTASGAFPISWPLNGRVVSSAADAQEWPTITSDGKWSIVAWHDFRPGTEDDIYAQRLSPSGYLAQPNPNISRIFDVRFDQGGFVNLQWDASYLDTNILDDPAGGGSYLVDHYWVLRSVPAPAGALALSSTEPVATLQSLGTAGNGAAPALVATGNSASTLYWEPLRRIDALHLPGYSYVAPTTSDSTPMGNPRTLFMVVAYDVTGTILLPSDPDSGYSVDNLSPATPGPLTANYGGGATHLHWAPNADPDVANYRVYRGSSATFVPGPANLVGSPPDTGFADAGAPGGYYKVSAVDLHGNEGGSALITPAGTLGVGEGPAPVLALARPSPNPAHGPARIGFTLANEARVSLTVYDVAGRLERVLAVGVLPAGEHAASWDLRDQSGAPARAGLYFVRLEAQGRSLSQRLVVTGP